MDAEKLLEIIANGETSKVQFKEVFSNADSIATELVAFSNAKGGMILFGINEKTGAVTGLDFASLREIGSKMSQIATDLVRPIIPITTEVIALQYDGETRRVLVVYVEEGTAKPYKDRNGTIWMKQGSDKRKLTENAEIIRLFQQSGIVFTDEMTVPDTSLDDTDERLIKDYLSHIGNEDMDVSEAICQNLNILKNGRLTLGGLLFFGKEPQRFRPAFCVKAVSFYGNDLAGSSYRDSIDIVGVIPDIFKGMMSFLKNNLHHTQQGQNFNSTGILEISEIALEELCQNALTHRDYSKNASVNLLIFDNRVEIISPGALPNSLTIENIKMGNAVMRNPLIASFCAKTMKYRGLGSGIVRALKEQPDIHFINDSNGEQFKVIIPRKNAD